MLLALPAAPRTPGGKRKMPAGGNLRGSVFGKEEWKGAVAGAFAGKENAVVKPCKALTTAAEESGGNGPEPDARGRLVFGAGGNQGWTRMENSCSRQGR